jgi:hypothetical protein
MGVWTLGFKEAKTSYLSVFHENSQKPTEPEHIVHWKNGIIVR